MPYTSYRFFNLMMDEVLTRLDRFTLEDLANGDAANFLPKTIKLSDSGVGMVIANGVSYTRSCQRWPLHFNAAGYPHIFFLHPKIRRYVNSARN